MIAWMTTSIAPEEEETEEEKEAGMSEAQKLEEEEMQRLEEGLASASEMRKSVLDFITKDPKYTSAVVRKWLREKATV